MNRGEKKLLKEALLEAQLQEFSQFPSEEELDESIIFSHQMNNYIRNLASYADKKQRKFIYIGLHPIRKAVAVFLVLLVLTAPITVPAVTKGIIQIIQLIKGTFVEVHYDIPQELLETIPDEIVYYGEPTWLPQGYQLQERVIDCASCYSHFTSLDHEPIYLVQVILSDTGASLDNDETTLTEVMIQNTYPCIVLSKEGYTTLTWNDGYYQYSLYGFLSINDALTIANSIIPVTK